MDEDYKQALKRKYLLKAQSLSQKRKQNLWSSPARQSIEWQPLVSSTPISSDKTTSRHPLHAGNSHYHENVNRELKRLLLASVGGDLEHELEKIVKEKVHLKQNLEDSIHHLMECTEDMDQLSVECDVWRSKVLASRVMIDQLTSWKTAHSVNYHQSVDAIKLLLKEREQLTHHISLCHNSIMRISKLLGQTTSSQPPHQYGGLQVATVTPVQLQPSTDGVTVLDLAKNNTTAANVVYEKINESIKGPSILPPSSSSLPHITPSEGEKMAEKAIYPVENASTLVSQPIPHLSFREQYLIDQRKPRFWNYQTVSDAGELSFNYCSKCTGKVQLV